jgi:ElaB/YqjD/DUF883 family membrane-anchored ribosome-binding protein
MASADLLAELEILKRDLSRTIDGARTRFADASKARVDETAAQIKSAIGDLGEVLAAEEQQIEGLVAQRPLAALASAFAVGLLVGALLRRH